MSLPALERSVGPVEKVADSRAPPATSDGERSRPRCSTRHEINDFLIELIRSLKRQHVSCAFDDVELCSRNERFKLLGQPRRPPWGLVSATIESRTGSRPIDRSPASDCRAAQRV